MTALAEETQERVPLITKLRAMSSIMTSRLGLARAAGMTFDGLRDLFKQLGYKTSLEPTDYRNRYKRNAVAARVVEAFPQGTWRGLGELIEVEDPKTETEFEKAWWKLSERLRIWPTFLKADILAGLGHYSVILLGAPGALKSPLPTVIKPEDLKFMQPFAQDDAKVKSYSRDVRDERFGQPLMYEFKRLDVSRNSPTEVHWTRVIHVPCDGNLDDNINGIPRLERVWNLLDDLEKVTGAGAEAFWLRAHQGYQFDIDKELELDDTGEKQLEEQVDKFMHGISRAMRTRGMKVTALGSDVATFDRNVASILSQISSGSRIPQRILMGSEQGQLASEQDRVNWAERVQDRRTEFAGPVVVRQTIDRFIKHQILPTPRQYDTRWPQVFDLSDLERATIAGKWAEINQKNRVVTVTVDEIRDRILGLAPLPKELQTPIVQPGNREPNPNRPPEPAV